MLPEPPSMLMPRAISEDRKRAVDSRNCFKPWAIDITIISGAKLRAGDLGILASRYVRMTLEGKQEQTKHVRRSNNPSWNEKFRLFAMLKRSVLRVACFDHENMTADEPIGFFEIELSTLIPDEEYLNDFKLENGKEGSSLRVSLRLKANFLLLVTDDTTTDCFAMNDEMVQSNSLVLSRHIMNNKAAWAGVDMALFDLTWLDGSQKSVIDHVESILDQIFGFSQPDVSAASRIAAEKCTKILQQCLTCAGQLSDKDMSDILSTVCNLFYLRVGSEISVQIPMLQTSLIVENSGDSDPAVFLFKDWVRVVCQLVDGDLISNAIKRALKPYNLCCIPTPHLSDLVDLEEILERFGSVIEDEFQPRMDMLVQQVLEKSFLLTATIEDVKNIMTLFLIDIPLYYNRHFETIVKMFDCTEKQATKCVLMVRLAEALLRCMTKHIVNSAAFVRKYRCSTEFQCEKLGLPSDESNFVLQLGFFIDSSAVVERFRNFLFEACDAFPDELSDAAQQVLAPYFGRAKVEFRKLESESVATLVSLILETATTGKSNNWYTGVVPRNERRGSLMKSLSNMGSFPEFRAPSYKLLFDIILRASEKDPHIYPTEVSELFSFEARVRIVDELIGNIFSWAVQAGSNIPSPKLQLEALQWALNDGPSRFGHDDIVKALISECERRGSSIIQWDLLEHETFKIPKFQRRLKRILKLCLEESVSLQQLLKVKIIGAHELQHERRGAKTDPYVVVTVRDISFPHAIVAGPFRTRVMKNNVSPVWDEEAHFVVDSTKLYKRELYCEIFDWERVLKHRCIGRVRHSLAPYDLELGKTRGQDKATVSSDVNIGERVQGKLHFSLRIEDAPHAGIKAPSTSALNAFAAVDARKLIEGNLNPKYVHFQCHGRALFVEKYVSDPYLWMSLEALAEKQFSSELNKARESSLGSSLLLLYHPRIRIRIYELSRKTSSEENIEFWVVAKKFHSRWCNVNISSAFAVEEMKKDAMWIIDMFIRDDAEKQITLKANYKNNILDSISDTADRGSLTSELFEPSLQSVEEILKQKLQIFLRENESSTLLKFF